jgi:ubiquinone biosynthesis monooxygenase Coq7
MKDEVLQKILRVNHAGEFGAKRIYQGQLSVLKNKPAAKNIKHMLEQELVHLEYFENKLIENKVRPSILMPLWNVAGFALGAITALIGEKTAYACTVAVEEVIEDHYKEQQNILKNQEVTYPDLEQKIEQFRQEEIEHRNISLENHAQEATGYNLISELIKNFSKLSIKLAKRF